MGVLRQHVPNELEEHGVDNLNVTVVCTHAEVSNTAEAVQLKKKYFSKGNSVDKREVEELEKWQKDKSLPLVEKKKAKRKLRHKLLKACIEDVTSKFKQAYAAEAQGRSRSFASQTQSTRKARAKGTLMGSIAPEYLR